MVAGAAFAADANASVYMSADLLNISKSGDTTTVDALTLKTQSQKDSKELVFAFNGEKAGAEIEWYTTYAGGSENVVQNYMKLWFAPIEQVKVWLGNVGGYGYVERIDWWKKVTGSSYAQYNNWEGKFSSFMSVEGVGFMTEIKPIPALWITAGITNGIDKASISKVTNVDLAYAPYGISARYTIADNITAQIAWRDAGKDANKILSIGGDYGKWGDPVYQYVDFRLFFSNHTAAWGSEDAKGMTVRGIGVDNYGYFTAGAFKCEYTIPVVIRGLVKLDGVDDPSYMTFCVKASYALDGGYTPYLRIDNNDAALSFDKNFADCFSVGIQPGITFSVGECAIDASMRISPLDNSSATNVGFSVPVTFKVAF